jgi:4'-phosphopantetheinyl transferase
MSAVPASDSGPRLLAGLADEAHLWLVRLRESIPPEVESRWHDLLSPEEEAANRRFRVETARREHLAARALVRTTLSRYADVAPHRWRFREGPQGRPEIDGPAGAPPLRFNLSHTRGLVALVVTLELDAGVDVERPARRLKDPLALARHGFAPAEQRALERLGASARRELFCHLWTLKEAYVKARGSGILALPASRVACEIASDGLIGMSFDGELEDRPEDWQLALLAATGEHRLAVAVRRGGRPDLRLVIREVEPPAPSARRVRPEILARSPAPAAAGAGAG